MKPIRLAGMGSLLLLFFFLFTACGAQRREVGKITVYADKGLRTSLTEIAKDYTAQEGHEVSLTFEDSKTIVSEAYGTRGGDLLLFERSAGVNGLMAKQVIDNFLVVAKKTTYTQDKGLPVNHTYVMAKLMRGGNYYGAQLFADYIQSAAGKKALKNAGLTI